MLHNAFKKKLDTLISDKINEAIMYNKIHNIVSEEMKKYQKHLVTEADSIEMKRKAVMNMLKDGKYNHAELMRSIYHPKDKGEEDTYRSLFSKKATGKPDADGSVRHFDDSEITKLYQILRAH